MNCPRCHAPIPADGPAGMCPKCLLSVGLGEPEVVLTAAGEPAPPPPTPAELQPHFPQFEILRLVGRGGMGAVYEARQKGLQRSVALKILAAPTRADSSFEERFVREAQALARLSHENIVAVYDAGRAGPHFYLAMEYVDGPNLRQAERAGHIEPAQALALVVQICAALDYAHKNGIVHRDIKPENVLLTRDGKVKIVDFGLAKVLDRAARGLSLTRVSQTMGTPHYMAPEQIERPKDVDHRADIYSLGVVFYELLTGELPLGRFPLPSQKVSIDVRLDEIVIRTLEKEPDRRYQAAGEVRTAVQGVASSPMQHAATEPAIAASATPVSGRWTPAKVAVLLLALMLLGVASILVLMVWGTDHLEAPQRASVTSPVQPAPPADALAPRMPPLPPDLAQVQARVKSVVQKLSVASGEVPRALVFEALAGDIAGTESSLDRLRAVDTVLTLVDTSGEGDSLRRYREHEAARTTRLPLANDKQLAAVRIEPTHDLVVALRKDLRRELNERLGPLALSEQHVEWLVQEHMPFDSGPIEVRVSRDGPSWIVESNSAAGQRQVETFDELPNRYKRLVSAFQANSSPMGSVVLEPAVAAAPAPAKPAAPEIVWIPEPNASDPLRTQDIESFRSAARVLSRHGGGLLDQYLALESAHSTVERPDEPGEIARVRISAFTSERVVIESMMWAVLARELDVKTFGVLRDRDFSLAALPFGDRPCTVHVYERDGHFVHSTRGEGWTRQGEAAELPAPFQRIVARARSRP